MRRRSWLDPTSARVSSHGSRHFRAVRPIRPPRSTVETTTWRPGPPGASICTNRRHEGCNGAVRRDASSLDARWPRACGIAAGSGSVAENIRTCTGGVAVRHAHRRAWPLGLLALLTWALPAAFASPALAGPYTRLQVLLPGETAAPGTGSGKTGTPRAQVSGIPFDITVRACDNTWTLVTSISNSIQITSSDASATLPQPAQLQSGVRTFTVTLNAGGSFNFLAHDQTDNTIPDGVSATTTCQVLASFTFENISQKHKYAGVPDATTLTARDPNGNVVTGYAGPAGLKETTSFGEGRVSPTQVTLTNGVWQGNLTMFRADETSINRGNVNKFAYDLSNPAKNGSSDPFIVHPGSFSKVQIIVPGLTPLPGSVSGYTGSPATQAVGTGFTASVYATDAYWNPVVSGDNVRATATGSYTASPTQGLLSNGLRQVNVTLNTVGSQTVTVGDLTNGSISFTDSSPLQVLASAPAGFAFVTITSPQTAGVSASVTINAVDSGGDLVPGYTGDAILTANTGVGSISPEQVTFTAGSWTGPVTFKGARGAVAPTCADYSAPPT